MLTRSVLCGMMLSVMAGCATNGYSIRADLGVDNHVNFTQPTLTAKVTIESKP
jgi:hypothetical protein